MSLKQYFDKLLEVSANDVDPKMEYHDTLNPKLWNNNKPKTGVKTSLMNVVDEFLKSIDEEITILDVTMLGSCCNYNYSRISDIDIHIIVDYKTDDLMYKYLKAMKGNWEKTHKIFFKGYPVEIYVQSSNEQISKTAAIYSLKTNKWIREPNKEVPPPKFDDPRVLKKAAAIMTSIDKAVEMTGEQAETELLKLKDEIKTLRKKGIAISGEYDVANLAFKTLRNNKYIDKLMKRLNEVIDQRLSVK